MVLYVGTIISVQTLGGNTLQLDDKNGTNASDMREYINESQMSGELEIHL